MVLTVLSAPYIKKQTLTDNTNPGVEDSEDDSHVPPLVPSGCEYLLWIPASLIPSEQQVRHLFDIFFRDIHPYIPVINKAEFYRQWNTNRESLPPLVVEAIFASAGRISNDPTVGLKWLHIYSSELSIL
jgi:hypothetical protein